MLLDRARPGAVGAAVVDHDDLVGAGDTAERGVQAAAELRHDALFVEERYHHRHDGTLFAHVVSLGRRRRSQPAIAHTVTVPAPSAALTAPSARPGAR